MQSLYSICLFLLDIKKRPYRVFSGVLSADAQFKNVSGSVSMFGELQRRSISLDEQNQSAKGIALFFHTDDDAFKLEFHDVKESVPLGIIKFGYAGHWCRVGSEKWKFPLFVSIIQITKPLQKK